MTWQYRDGCEARLFMVPWGYGGLKTAKDYWLKLCIFVKAGCLWITGRQAQPLSFLKIATFRSIINRLVGKVKPRLVFELWHIMSVTLFIEGKNDALAGEGKKILMAAVFAFHTDKAVVQIAAIEIAIDYMLDIGPQKPYCLEK
jgi:hypothetical protein